MGKRAVGSLAGLMIGVSLAFGQAQPPVGPFSPPLDRVALPGGGHGEPLHPPADAHGHKAHNGEEHHAEEPHHEEEEHEEAEELQRFWFEAAYLLWWIREAEFPPLITSGSAREPRPGALDSPSLQILLGGSDTRSLERNGARFTAGMWVDPSFGVEANFFFLGSREFPFSRASAGEPVLARPFFDVLAGRQDASLVSFPGLASGSVAFEFGTEFDGAEANGLTMLWWGKHCQVVGIAGFRYLHLGEDLFIREDVQVSPASPRFGGQRIIVTDRFETVNRFYGGQIGARARLHYDKWSLTLLSKVGFGTNSQTIDIGGRTEISTQPPTVQNAGLLALASNSGNFERNNFSVVPEVGVNLGLELTSYLEMFIGYTFIYFSDVVRPQDQIDLRINPNLIPTSATFNAGGPALPAVPFQETDFWAQGLNFGIVLRY